MRLPEAKTASQARWMVWSFLLLAILSMTLAALYVWGRLNGFDERDWLGQDRWYLFGLFMWSLLTIALLRLVKLAGAERDRLATHAAQQRLAEASRRETSESEDSAQADIPA
jgi:hypothetical protein